LTTSVSWVAELRGITLADAAVAILEGDERLANRRGSLLFAHFGLSGPVVLDISRVVSRHAEPTRLVARLDFLPAYNEADIDGWLRDQAHTAGKKQLAVVLGERLPRRLAEELLRQAGLAVDRKAAALSKEERARLGQAIKRTDLPLTGTLGFKKAEVTAGGVDLREVDSRTLASKKISSLFLAGEILDLDGPIGGYNFQAAWSTGWLAGSSVG
jgi:predicted Rossmann fold flavoprotein